MRTLDTEATHAAKPAAEHPEITLANAIWSDLHVCINPQALRMFLRARWDHVQHLAHQINESR